MEARVAELEQLDRVISMLLERIDRRLDMLQDDQRSNFQWLFGAMFAGTGAILIFILCLIGVMARGFHWL